MPQTAPETLTTPQPPEPQHPHPPRFWWTKRLLLALLLVALLVTGTRLWWGHYAERQFNQTIADLRARGEPALAEDLNRDPVPPETNAVTYLNQAYQALGPPDSPSAMRTTRWSDLSPPYPQPWLDAAAAAVEVNAAVFAPMRQARDHAEADWAIQYRTPMFQILLPMLNEQRHLANFIADAALHHHFNGDDAEALRLIEDLLFQGDAVDQESHLISHLVAVGIRALAVYRLQVIATGLTIEDAAHPANPNAAAPATREQVQTIIHRLLDEREQFEGLQRAFRGERVSLSDSILWMQQVTGARITRPMFQLEATRAMQPMTEVIEAARQPNWPAAMALAPSDKQLEANRDHLGYMLTSMLMPSFRRAATTSFRLIGDQRMIAVALAVRMYHNDHGHYPQTLDELVPHYLPFVPIDPFAADGRPLGYILAADGTRPIVYHVDEDGEDNTPDESVLPSCPLFGWQNRRQIYGQQIINTQPIDQWRDISAWQDPNPPPPPDDDEYLFDFEWLDE